MKGILIIFWLWLIPLLLQGQSFPMVITNSYQSTGTSPLNIRTGSPSGAAYTKFDVNTRLVATALVSGPTITGSNGSSSSHWWQVDLPGTTSAQTGYCIAGSTFTNPLCNSNYVTVTAASATILSSAGGTTAVTLSSSAAKGFRNQHFGYRSQKTLAGQTWFEIDLPENCSPQTGWLSAANASLSATGGDVLPKPVLSASPSGNNVQLSWTLDLQPTGTAWTAFTLYRSINGGSPTTINLPNNGPNSYTDPNYDPAKTYTYKLQAGYGVCSLQNSDPVILPATVVSSTGHIQVQLSPAGIGARWSLDGSGNYSSGDNIAASLGTHTITFSSVSGYTAPGPLSITLTSASPDQSRSVTYTAGNCVYPPAPADGNSVTVSSSEIDLDWTGVSGAVKYHIYDCSGRLFATSNAASYRATGLNPGTRYEFRLTSVNSQGCESQTPGACFSSTTMSAAGTYTVSGKVSTASGSGLAGVTIQTGTYSTTTDASGNYQLSNIPDTYYDAVRASLSGYSFNPSSISISNNDHSNKNFTGTAVSGGYNLTGKVSTEAGAPVAGIKLTVTPGGYTATSAADGSYSIALPANFSGTVTASGSGYTFTYADFSFNPQVHDHRDFTAIPIAVAAKITLLESSTIPPWQREGEPFSGTIRTDLSQASGKAWHLEIDVYTPGATSPSEFISYPSNTGDQQYFSSTDSQLSALISAGKIRNGSRLTYNAVLETGSTPATVAYSAKGTRIIGATWDKHTVVYNKSGNGKLQLPLTYQAGFNYQNLTVKFSRVDKTASPGIGINMLKNPPTLTVNTSLDGSNGTCILTNANANLDDVYPGEFTYTVNAGSILLESGTCSLVKIGQWMSTPNPYSHRVIVTIGGIYNQIEDNFKALHPEDKDRAAMQSFSIAPYLANDAIADLWYIAQGNVNTIKQNGYDIGIALDSIKSVKSPAEIDMICHSKGGLDTRAFIQNQSEGLDGHVKSFNTSAVKDVLKKIIFLGTPHRGSVRGGLIDEELSKATNWAWSNISNALLPEGLQDILTDRVLEPGSTLAQLQGSDWPKTIQYANVTGFLNWLPDTDGWVEVVSGTNPVPGCLQLYQAHGYHNNLHKNFYLAKDALCLSGYTQNIDLLAAFMKSAVVSSPCAPGTSSFKLATYGSVLPGATVALKTLGSTTYQPLGQGDEQGQLSLTPFTAPAPGDSLRISAGGYDTATLPVDDNLLSSHKLEIGLFRNSQPDHHIQYPALSLNGDPVTGSPTASFSLRGDNVRRYLINSSRKQDSTYIPLNLNGQQFSLPLDTGRNLISVQLIGDQDTVHLSKTIYYYPGALLDSLSYPITLKLGQAANHTRLYADDQYYGALSGDRSLRVLKKTTQLKLSQPGYLDKTIAVRRDTTISVALDPYDYTSATDSLVLDLKDAAPRYWKSISLKNQSTGSSSRISARQLAPDLKKLGLSPQSRAFQFLNLAGSMAKLRAIMALDQLLAPDPDSVYLLWRSGEQYKKIPLNSGNLAAYDPEVQKLAFDSLNLAAGQSASLVLARKQAPILLQPQNLSLAECQASGLPVSTFVRDPDSLKNDLQVTSLTDGVAIRNNEVVFTRNAGHTGRFQFRLAFTHDQLTRQQDLSIELTRCPVSPVNTITPNGDGINDTWNIPELSGFPDCTVHIYSRSGAEVFRSKGYGRAWDGTLNGRPLPTGAYYYVIDLQAKGYELLKGEVTLIR